MRFRNVPVLLVLALAPLFTPPASAAPPEVPKTLSAKVGKPVLFDVKTDGAKPFGWAPGFDKAKCPVVRLYSDDPAVSSFMAIPDEAGSYVLTFWTIGAGEKGFSQVVIATEEKPVPPVPPGPPIPPAPTDPFSLAIQAAFTAELAPDKLTSAGKLASVYRMAAKSTVRDTTITTTGQLFDVMTKASRVMLAETAIPKVRAVIGSRLNPIFGTSVTLDRDRIAAEFNAIADALSAVK